jgi:2,3-bisphosphoglycerate-dependent phosphoglycerate mutase
VDLSEQGKQEAARAGRLQRERGYGFDIGFTSVLKRVIKTLHITLEGMALLWLPVQKSWRLNERFYGALQGLNKAESAVQFGAEQVQRWGHDPHKQPPALTRADSRFPGHDACYQHLTARELSLTENLSATLARVLPFWTEQIMGPSAVNSEYSSAPTVIACGLWYSISTT